MSLDLSRLHPGLTGTALVVAGTPHSARCAGSGTLDVFATPMMVALMEAAAVDCVERLLPPGCTSLGTHVDVSHDAPTPLGMTIHATATLKSIDARTLNFQVEARDGTEVIGRGSHRRVVVDIEKFMQKLARKAAVAS